MFKEKKHLLSVGIGLAILLVLVIPFVVQAQGETPHGNANCLMCHSDPDFTGHLPSGETLSLYVEPSEYYQSVHAAAGLECLACHVDQQDYPHGETEQLSCSKCHPEISDGVSLDAVKYQPLNVTLPYEDAREVTLTFNEECRLCHEEKFEEAVDSAHSRVQDGGNRFAPVCVDCHGSHDITSPNEPRIKISETCSECHLSVYTTYKSSIHGQALVGDGNPDVPTCVDCHGVHNVAGPREAEFRDSTIAICGGCHADEDRMEKYGISTAVFDTYLDDFHGRSVDFFRREDPGRPSNKATCFDCHGIHNIRSPEDAYSTVYPDNLQRTCQQCHEDASITFPQAWLGHYSPSWERTPTLYAVDKVYQALVPTVIGGMLGYVALDAKKRFFTTNAKKKKKEEYIEVEESVDDNE